MIQAQDGIVIPKGAAVAFTDGGFGRHGFGCGMVFIHGRSALLQGAPVPDAEDPWDPEAAGVRMAIDHALSIGVTHLRLLIDRHGLAMFVQGFQPEEPTEREAGLRARLSQATASGLQVSARVVQGHTETMDLPSRLNDLAHHLSGISIRAPFRQEHAVEPHWLDQLVAWDSRFTPTRTPQRWAFEFPRRRCAHFLGVDIETVDALYQAGHLVMGRRGVTRASVAKVYEVAQFMRRGGYFGFSEREGMEGRWDDEVSRGWDGRPSKFYHRKSGIRRPPGEEPVKDHGWLRLSPPGVAVEGSLGP